jgi:transcriptional activator SPT7
MRSVEITALLKKLNTPLPPSSLPSSRVSLIVCGYCPRPSSELSSKPQPPPPPAIPSSTDPPLLATLVNQPPPSLSAQVYQNIASLQKVQRIHSQLAALDANDPTLSPSKRAAELPPTLPYPSTEGGDEDEEEPDEVREAKRVERESRRRLPANPKARVPRRPETSSSQALEGLKLVSGTMLAHAGFEGAQQAALDTITDVTATFLANLGKALRFYVDTHGHKMTSEVRPSLKMDTVLTSL